MLVGKILWWDAKDNNGIIKAGDGTKYYFDSSVLKSIRSDKLKARTIVTFEPNTAIKNCLCAKNVSAPNAKTLKSIQKKFCEAQQLDLLEMGGVA